MLHTVRPASGRDYKTPSDAIKDWNANKDFIHACGICPGGMYINKADLEKYLPNDRVKIRFNKLTESVEVPK